MTPNFLYPKPAMSTTRDHNLVPNPNCGGGAKGNAILTGGEHFSRGEQTSTQHQYLGAF